MAEVTEGQRAVIASVVGFKDGTPRSLEKASPVNAVACLEMLAEGATYREIKARLGLSLNTVTALKLRHQDSLDVRRKELAAHAAEMAEMNRQVSKMKYEQLANDPESLSKVNIKDLAIAHGIYQEKEMAARGEATKIHEIRSGKPSLADAVAVIQEARTKAMAEAVNIIGRPVVPVVDPLHTAADGMPGEPASGCSDPHETKPPCA